MGTQNPQRDETEQSHHSLTCLRRGRSKARQSNASEQGAAARGDGRQRHLRRSASGMGTCVPVCATADTAVVGTRMPPPRVRGPPRGGSFAFRGPTAVRGLRQLLGFFIGRARALAARNATETVGTRRTLGRSRVACSVLSGKRSRFLLRKSVQGRFSSQKRFSSVHTHAAASELLPKPTEPLAYGAAPLTRAQRHAHATAYPTRPPAQAPTRTPVSASQAFTCALARGAQALCPVGFPVQTACDAGAG